VQYQSALSEWEILSCGVPQGTLFGPIIFVAMINDAADNSRTSGFKYVDDLSLAEVRPAGVPSRIHLDVQDMDEWCNENHLQLNPSKCKVMQVCFKLSPPCPPDLEIAGKKLEVVTETKILGLTIQSNLCWDHHVNSMISKCSRRLYMLSRLKRFGIPVKDLVSVYVGYVRPLVEYAVPVWNGSITARQTQQLERIQKRACRIILGPTYTTYTEALATTNLQSLVDRRYHLCSQFANKCITSDRYVDLFPVNNRTHTMCTRMKTKPYRVPRYRTERYGNSSIPYLTKILNMQ